MEEIVETTSGQRGTRCTVGLHTPAIITGGLPLIILLDEEEGTADVKQPDFTEDTNSGTRPKRTTTERVAGDETKTIGRQDPMIPGRSAESETLLGTRPKIMGARANVDSAKREHFRDGASSGGPFPATGTVENSLTTLNFDSSKYPQKFVIRAFGFNEPAKPIYGILEYADGHIMGTLAVDEMAETIHLKDHTGVDLLTATGGLKHPWGRMNVASPSNQVAVIDQTAIHFSSDNIEFTLKSCEDPTEENYIILHRGKDQVCISEHEDSIKLETNSQLSNLQFAVALLHALQVLYKLSINTRRMPYGFLVQKPPATYRHFTFSQTHLSVLKDLGGLTLRMACRIDSINWFADFISIAKYRNRIMLILVKTEDRYEFRQTSGIPHFFAKRDDEMISVFTSNPILPVGTINYDVRCGECYDRHNVLQMLIFKRPIIEYRSVDNKLNKDSYAIYAQDGLRKIGTIQCSYHMTSIHFRHEESWERKAFIIAYASMIAETKYGISKQVVPKIQKYPA